METHTLGKLPAVALSETPSTRVSELGAFDDHELVVYLNDEATGLHGFVAIHNTNLGPATGGTRYWRYASETEALTDALQLSRAMTYKCALADVAYGGGKGVIIADRPKTTAFLRAYARRIDMLGGIFTTGEDVGISDRDVKIMASESPFINGMRGAGDLSPWAARGVYYAMQAAVGAYFGAAHMRGRTIAVKGLGKLGLHLCQLLQKEGARLVGADVEPRAVQKARRLFPNMRIVRPADIHKERVDVYAPCALGSEFDSRTIKELRCALICGGANNQLATPADGERLHRRGILYVPDYLANAGGLINVVGEMRSGGYNVSWVERKVRAIRATATQVITASVRRKKPTSEVADEMARSRFGTRRKARF